MILCAILGALLGLSFKSRDVIRRQNIPADNFPALTVQYQYVKHAADEEQLTIATLQKRVTELENGTSSNSKQVKALLEDLNQTKLMAGLVGTVGPGVIVTLNDSKKTLPPDWPAGTAPPNIIHDTDINMFVNELKAAGAEAVSINSQRLVAVTAVRCAGPTVFVNNVAQTPPYVIRAIGDDKALQGALNLPQGVVYQMSLFDPGMVKVQTASRIVVPAYSGASQPKYAKPLAAQSADGDSRVAATP